MNLDSAVLYTNDIDRIARFYEGTIGLKLEYKQEAYVSFIFPNSARLGINISEFDREKPGSQTFFVSVNDIKKHYKKYVKLGFDFFEDFEEHEWGKYFAVLDPDGNKVGFIQRKQ